jgi:localization factor PodJL
MQANGAIDIQVGGPPSEGQRAPVGTCEAGDLKSLLERIVEHIIDADRRQSEQLRALNDRMSGSRDLPARPPSNSLPSASPVTSEPSVRPEGAPTVTRQQSEPQPMIPVANSLPIEREAQSRSRRQVTAPAPTAIDPDSHWDAASAEMLAALYETGEVMAGKRIAGLAEVAPPAEPAVEDSLAWLPSTDVESLPPVPESPLEAKPAPGAAAVGSGATAMAAPSPVAMAQFEAHEAPVPAETGSHATADRSWLEERLQDLAMRFEESLQRLDVGAATSAVGALAGRLGEVEGRLASAIENGPTRADLAGLAVIEAQVNEMSGQLESSLASLGRIDGIEQRLAGLASTLTPERVASLVKPASLSRTEVQEIAGAVATLVAERMVPAVTAGVSERVNGELRAAIDQSMVTRTAADPGADGADLGEIRGILATLMSEQRHGDEATAGALDTIQQAMVSLLDRMEELEQSIYIEHDEGAGQAAEPLPARATELTVASSSASPQRASAVAPQRAAPSETNGTPPPRQNAHSPVVPPQAPAHGDDAGQPNREEFIAAARRAMRQAQAQKAADEAADAAAAEKEAPVRAKAGIRAKVLGGEAGKGGGLKLDRRVLIAALAAMVIAFGGYQFLKKPRPVAPTAESKVERKMLTPETERRDRERQGRLPVDQPAERSGGQQAAPSNGQSPADATGTVRRMSEAGSAADAFARDASAPALRDISLTDAEVPPGITLQFPASPPSEVSLQRAKDRETIARLSGQLGAAQIIRDAAEEGEEVEDVRPSPAALAAATPAAADTVGRVVEAGPPPVATTAALPARGRSSEMPPALVGPLSLRLAAQQGDPSAEFEVGARLAEGRGIPQDLKQAVVWYQRSAAQGFAAAQYRLGSMYERGLGVAADLGKARIWYTRAAEQGNVKAMHNLAVLSAGNSFGGPDYATAARWFTEAAERGLADSQFNLAILYESGLGVAKDLRQAYKWQALAARTGDKQAVKRLAEIGRRLPPGAQPAIEQDVAEWRAKPADRIANEARAAGELWKSRVSGQASG